MAQVRRLPRSGVAALLALTLVTGCASVVDGDGAPGTQGRTSITGGPTGSSPTGAPTSTTPASSPTNPETDLTALLAPAPPGSRPWGTTWSKNATPTLAEFVAHVYPAKSVPVAKSQLEAQGLKDIAHRTWIGTDSNQADTILLRFDTTAGAVSRYRSATAAQADDQAQLHFDVPGYAEAIGYYKTALDDLGDVRTILYGQVGDIVAEVFFYSPAKLDKTAAIAAITAQLRLLPS